MEAPTIILTRSDVRELLTLPECISGIEQAFKMFAEGEASPPGILGIHAENGGFHIKAGLLNLKRHYFVAKANANFPGNPVKHGLPTIQGVVTVSDASDGRLLALMDSIELTIIRTGAATAVAAKYLSKENSKVATIVGCGEQGLISVRMLMQVRKIENLILFDLDEKKSHNLAAEISEEYPVTIEFGKELQKALSKSDICVTCTTSRQPFIRKEYLSPGIFIAAVGADNEEKQEIDSDVLSSVKVVTDITSQAASIGELHHAIQNGLMKPADVYAELGEVIAGKKKGRVSENEIILFDSTGMALQDVAAASIVFEKARKSERGITVNFNS